MHQPQICRDGLVGTWMLPPSVRWERSSQGWGRLGRCPPASPEPAGHPGHLCFPGRQRGHELSTPVTGMDLKIKMHDMLLGRRSAEKAHLCFVLSFQFESDFRYFLPATTQVTHCDSQVHTVLIHRLFLMEEIEKQPCPVHVGSTGKAPGAASTETSQQQKCRI